MRRRELMFGLAALSAGLPVLGGCTNQGGPGTQAQTEIYILVDLSETWFNPSSRDRNARVLGEVGAGIAIAAADLQAPILIQHRIIGANSLEREPVCSVTYAPTLVAVRNNDRAFLTRPRALQSYLQDDCPAVLMARPPEPLTEISAALASVAAQPRRTETRRFMLILSDFLEEARNPAPLNTGSLEGTTCVLLYRPLAEDQMSPAAMQARVGAWRDLLRATGATVTTMPDTGLRRAQIAGLFQS